LEIRRVAVRVQGHEAGADHHTQGPTREVRATGGGRGDLHRPGGPDHPPAPAKGPHRGAEEDPGRHGEDRGGDQGGGPRGRGARRLQGSG